MQPSAFACSGLRHQFHLREMSRRTDHPAARHLHPFVVMPLLVTALCPCLSRQFRKSCGRPPYTWVMARHIERARSALPIKAVAARSCRSASFHAARLRAAIPKQPFSQCCSIMLASMAAVRDKSAVRRCCSRSNFVSAPPLLGQGAPDVASLDLQDMITPMPLAKIMSIPAMVQPSGSSPKNMKPQKIAKMM